VGPVAAGPSGPAATITVTDSRAFPDVPGRILDSAPHRCFRARNR
jgi:hypothetical protein